MGVDYYIAFRKSPKDKWKLLWWTRGFMDIDEYIDDDGQLLVKEITEMLRKKYFDDDIDAECIDLQEMLEETKLDETPKIPMRMFAQILKCMDHCNKKDYTDIRWAMLLAAVTALKAAGYEVQIVNDGGGPTEEIVAEGDFIGDLFEF